MSQSKAPQLSVIVPVLHEEGRIGFLAGHVAELARSDGVDVQLVIVDGDCAGSTLAALPDAERAGVVGVCAGPGRAAQMNAGARVATGEVLLFLHADTRLPCGAFARIFQVLGNGLAQVGAFDFQFDAAGFPYAMLAWAGRLRSRLERCPYGDQAHFFPRAVFFGLGGYPDIPLMEDVELMWRVRRRRLPLCVLPDRVTTSSRRYAEEGPIRRVLRNFCLRTAHAFGADPAKLAQQYRPHAGDEDRRMVP